jgi:hypothetical protein
LRGGVDNGALAVITVNASTPENTDKVIVLATHKGSASFTMRPLHRDLCINMNNHQNAIFHQLDNFIKHSHSFAMTIFHKITKSAKLVILLIIPTYAKVSHK